MKKTIALLFCVLLLNCKTKTVDSSSMVTHPIDPKSIIKDTGFFFKEIHQPLPFNQVKINSKINITAEQFIPPLNSVIYIEKDKKIWINLSSYFVNIGRGLAEQQTFKGYLKQPEKLAIEGSYEHLKSLLKLDFLDYNSLQNLLLGRTFISVNHNNYILTKSMEGYVLYSKKGIDFQKEEKYQIALYYSKNFQLEKVRISNHTDKQEVIILFSERTTLKDFNLPKSVKIIIKETKTSVISIENTKFEDSEMKIPFRMPKNYKKVQLHD